MLQFRTQERGFEEYSRASGECLAECELGKYGELSFSHLRLDLYKMLKIRG